MFLLSKDYFSSLLFVGGEQDLKTGFAIEKMRVSGDSVVATRLAAVQQAVMTPHTAQSGTALSALPCFSVLQRGDLVTRLRDDEVVSVYRVAGIDGVRWNRGGSVKGVEFRYVLSPVSEGYEVSVSASRLGVESALLAQRVVPLSGLAGSFRAQLHPDFLDAAEAARFDYRIFEAIEYLTARFGAVAARYERFVARGRPLASVTDIADRLRASPSVSPVYQRSA